MKEKISHSKYYTIYWILFIFLCSALFYSIYTQHHKLQVSISTLDSELENQRQLLAKFQKKERIQGYLLEDIRSRLEMANFELAVLHNVKAATHLLQITEEVIKSSQDPIFFKLQKAISKKIVDLQAIPVLDVENVVLRIEKIGNEIEALPIIKSHVKPVEVAVADTEGPIWKRLVTAVIQTLKESIVIRHHTVPTLPLLPPTEQAYLINNIRSQLDQASWAVLHNQQVIYEHAISQAISWIKQYYREDIEVVQSVLQRLNALQKLDVSPVLSDISDILKQLDELSA